MMAAAVRARSAAVSCAEANAWSLSDADVSSALTAVHRAEQAIVSAKLHLVREFDARGVAPGGAAAWLREHLRLSASAARRLVALAAAIDARPGVDAALIAGVVDTEQAGTITAALDELPAEVGPEVIAKAEAMLVSWAGEFAAPALRTLGQRVLAHVAPEVAEQAEARVLARQEHAAHVARTLSLRSIGAGRYRLTGVLDAEAAAVMTAALDPLCSPRANRDITPPDTTAHGPPAEGLPIEGSPAEGSPAGLMLGTSLAGRSDADVRADPIRHARVASLDERSPGQRRADALIDVCRLALGSSALPASGGDRPQLSVTVPYDAVRRLLGTGTLDTGDRISATQVRRLACDAHLIPAVLDGAGRVLDLGQTRRLITGALRRALVLRDKGCAFPGCDRPPRWCDGHHIRSWADGGPTRLDNAVLLCGHHHRTVHHGDWTARIAADGLPEFIPPAQRDPHRRPRRNILHDRQ